MARRRLVRAYALAAGAASCLAAVAIASPQEAGPARADASPKGAPGPGRGGPSFGPGTFLAPVILEEADADADGKLTPAEAAKAASAFVREADAGKAGSIDAAAFGKAINRELGPPPGPGGPPGGDFGPGMFFGAQVLAAADADHDGKLTPDEAAKAAEAFVVQADADKKGGLDLAALARAMNRRMGPPPGMGGPGGPGGAPRALLKTFDKDRNGRLDRAERLAAWADVKKANGPGGPRRFGPPPGFGHEAEPTKPGPHVSPADVASYPSATPYDPAVVRTLFLDFEDKDWEPEMAAFYRSDVDLPATLTVDGKAYPNVGVHFRGMSSFFAVQEGHKRSLNVALDFVNPDQTFRGRKTLNLLNAHEDPSFLRTVLFLQIARQYVKAPRANFVRLVVNGESWGLYVNAEQFDRKFLADNFGTANGTRWKVPGNPGADGGLNYVGEKVADYQSRYELKGKGGDADWKALILLCKTLSEAPADRLEAALRPMLDIDGALWFLALDNALINNDGYWARASDYSLYRDPRGVFHVIPHDANETLQAVMVMGPRPGGPGRRGGGGRPGGGPPGAPGGGPGGPPPGGSGGFDLDPLIGLDDTGKPLRSRLLAVPALRAQYLAHVRTIASEWLDWQKLGPIVAGYRALIEKDVEADTRKLASLDAFRKAVAESAPEAGPGPGGHVASLRAFADGRRKFLLEHPAVKGVAP